MESKYLRPVTDVLSVLALFCATYAMGAEAAQQFTGRDLWSQPQEPVRLYGNTYYVGTRGLSSVLITSNAGHVLIDGDLPETVPQILANVRQLGFEARDIKFILNSHAHFDHAGGIAELQKVTGAKVISSASGAAALERGAGGQDDPQYTLRDTFPAVAEVDVLEDGGTLELGDLALTVHYTPGHTPGGTSWTWQSCEQNRCLNLVYADSLNAVSSDDFKYSGDPRYPRAADDLKKSISRIERLPCDILISAHPEGSDLWTKVERRRAGQSDALIAKDACRTYAEAGRKRLESRLAKERSSASTDE
jgi:metallo-beta-lactamase class B